MLAENRLKKLRRFSQESKSGIERGGFIGGNMLQATKYFEHYLLM